MKYKLRNENFCSDVVTNIFQGRGIDDVDTLCCPPIPKAIDFSKIANIEDGIAMFTKHISKGKILLVQDTDVDGITAASIVYQVSKILKPHSNITLHFHPAKEHGLSPDVMGREDLDTFDLIILPDAGTNDKAQLEKLMAMGIEVLVLDHHEIEEELNFENTVIINNQRKDCSLNSNFSGVGVTYFFFKALVCKYNLPLNMDIFLDLVAVGTVADSMDVTDLEVRWYVEEGFKNIKNKLLQTYFNEKEMYYKTISWGIASLINAVIRYATQEEKEQIFYALSNQNLTKIIRKNKKKKNKKTGKFDIIEVEMSEYDIALDLAASIKAKQDKDVKSLTDELLKRYCGQNIGMFVVGAETKTINGLVANKVAEKIQKPVLIVSENYGNYYGSARGYDKYMSNFKNWCEKTGLFEFCMGHSNAFGVSINQTNFVELSIRSMSLKKQETIIEVDAIYQGKPNRRDVERLELYKKVWCKNCEEPVFAIENVVVNKKDLKYSSGSLRFFVNGTRFVKRGTTKEEYEMLINDKLKTTYNLNILGKASIVDIYGKKYVEVDIDDYEILENVDYSYFF